MLQFVRIMKEFKNYTICKLESKEVYVKLDIVIIITLQTRVFS
jgi:hypothetical protein